MMKIAPAVILFGVILMTTCNGVSSHNALSAEDAPNTDIKVVKRLPDRVYVLALIGLHLVYPPVARFLARIITAPVRLIYNVVRFPYNLVHTILSAPSSIAQYVAGIPRRIIGIPREIVSSAINVIKKTVNTISGLVHVVTTIISTILGKPVEVFGMIYQF